MYIRMYVRKYLLSVCNFTPPMNQQVMHLWCPHLHTTSSVYVHARLHNGHRTIETYSSD